VQGGVICVPLCLLLMLRGAAGGMLWHGRDLRQYRRLLSPPMELLGTCPGQHMASHHQQQHLCDSAFTLSAHKGCSGTSQMARLVVSRPILAVVALSTWRKPNACIWCGCLQHTVCSVHMGRLGQQAMSPMCLLVELACS